LGDASKFIFLSFTWEREERMGLSEGVVLIEKGEMEMKRGTEGEKRVCEVEKEVVNDDMTSLTSKTGEVCFT
jgi:hypothetical protein